MEKTNVAIVGGGAAGLILANLLADKEKITLLERGERLGRKLSATGNGQGNLTNIAVKDTPYFSLAGGEKAQDFAQKLTRRFDDASFRAFFETLGVPTIADERGRVYPAGRQASSLTDALRFALEEKKADIRLAAHVVRLEKREDGFLIVYQKEGNEQTMLAQKVVLCVGGKAAKNFGADGSAYALATGLGHTITPLYPSLVQLKTDTTHCKGLKGIRVNGGALSAELNGKTYSVNGDIIFTEYGVSGDAVFRVSAFIGGADLEKSVLHIDFLPAYGEEEIYRLLVDKQTRFSHLSEGELLFGVVNNQVGRAILRRAQGNLRLAAKLVKDFSLPVKGSLGFDYAQITKGGIPLSEITEGLESKLAQGLYFAGEVLDVDGACGGFNLQWAYASARLVEESIAKGRGQV